MRLTKKQLKVVDILSNGGYIWRAGDACYLAEVDAEGRVRSTPLNSRTFTALFEGGVLKAENKTWVIKR